MRLGAKKKKYTSYSQEKKRKKNLNLVIVGALSVTLTVSVYQLWVIDYYKAKVREETINELTSTESEFVQGYILNKPIEKGNRITAEDVEKVTRTKDIIPSDYIQDISQLQGMVARISLGENTILSSDMIVNMEEEITDSIKNQDYDWITVHEFLEQDQYVDIHYKEIDGTDTIVAAKKKILRLNGSVFAINISETERAYINNATVKTSIAGGELYTSIYPDPENQKAATVTYKLDREIEEQIKQDPNIVNEAAQKIKANLGDTILDDEVSNTTSTNNVVKKPEFIGGE